MTARNTGPCTISTARSQARSVLALAAPADGLGVALESTLLAERELAAGRLMTPLAGRPADCRYVGHRLVCPRNTRRGPLAVIVSWLEAELGLKS